MQSSMQSFAPTYLDSWDTEQIYKTFESWQQLSEMLQLLNFIQVLNTGLQASQKGDTLTAGAFHEKYLDF